MKTISRRDLLIAGGVMSLARSARGQQGVPFVVASAPVPFSLAGSVGIAVFASGPCTVEVALGVGTEPLSEPVRLSLTAARTSFTTGKTPVRRVESLVVQLRVTPVDGRPLVSAVIESPPKSGRDASIRAAENAYFVKNPAAGPGKFGIQLPFDSDVRTVIKQAAPPAQVVREKTDPNVQDRPGSNSLGFLANNSGARVPTGDYAATLLATPRTPGWDPTIFVSSVRLLVINAARDLSVRNCRSSVRDCRPADRRLETGELDAPVRLMTLAVFLGLSSPLFSQAPVTSLELNFTASAETFGAATKEYPRDLGQGR